ncbi:CPBP family intramembrane glutamic endopeptidase [Brachybacterium subflavum]|uniref:CPBP family intramembrane glutamic endopeptidase n=1 Tax=Brachybacterium subflavum TaxID=2585206 RepID=UPI001266804B|nr:type II CAAX endopeptidase family protein [Brachybacterium subflavum]
MTSSDAPQTPPSTDRTPGPPVGPTPPAPHAEARASVLHDRPFGAHVRTRWWAPIAVLVALMAIMFSSQIAAGILWLIATMALHGAAPAGSGLSPSLMLLTNLCLALLIPVSLLALRWIAGVPWRAALAVARPFSWGRALRGVVIVLLVIALALGAALLASPDLRAESAVQVGASTLPLVLITLLTTPLQAAGEEIMFRGTLLPLLGSWIRHRPLGAIILGTALSTVLFGLVHGATDPWLALYYTGFGLCGALLAIATGGIEASIAFHVGNNMVFMLFAALTVGDGGIVIDRSAAGGAGGPWVLGMLGLDLLVVAVLAMLGRRRTRRERRERAAEQRVTAARDRGPEVPANPATRAPGE